MDLRLANRFGYDCRKASDHTHNFTHNSLSVNASKMFHNSHFDTEFCNSHDQLLTRIEEFSPGVNPEMRVSGGSLVSPLCVTSVQLYNTCPVNWTLARSAGYFVFKG